jgi:hypothetical protein
VHNKLNSGATVTASDVIQTGGAPDAGRITITFVES